MSALIVEAGGDRFAIPQLAVIELVRAQGNSEHRIERIKDAPVLRLRNKLLPLIHLKKLLKMDGAEASNAENGFIVVTQVGNQTFGIVVDGVFHTEEIVVKPMSSKLRHIAMFSGNTILGDGSVIMIIDPNGIAQLVGTAGTRQEETEAAHIQHYLTLAALAFPEVAFTFHKDGRLIWQLPAQQERRPFLVMKSPSRFPPFYSCWRMTLRNYRRN